MITKEGLLAYIPRIRPRKLKQIREVFLSADAFWEADIAEIRQTLGWRDDVIAHIVDARKKIHEEEICQTLAREQITLIPFSDERYPSQLKEIHDPPVALFVRGNVDVLHRPSIAIVGTRKCTQYGRTQARRFATELSTTGLTVVSGLALGIDAEAHRGALDANAPTIAVLAGGVDKKAVSPKSHYGLAQDILSCGGTLVSEYPPATEPTKYSFPARNRIVAGLTQGVFVVEAPEKSGALITASFALDNNREVFALPHPISSLSGKGTNNVLKHGAHLVTDVHDMCSVLGLDLNQRKQEQGDDFLAVFSEPKHLDEVAAFWKESHAKTLQKLTTLELEGQITQVDHQTYIRR